MTSKLFFSEEPILSVKEDLIPLPTYKAVSTTSIDFSGLLETPLRLHEDLRTGCGGQIWPAGMVLARHMLRYQRNSLTQARILEIGAGGGLVGLAVAIGCQTSRPIYISDQENMIDLMRKNIAINDLESVVQELELNWGSELPAEIVEQRPDIILAADCVYLESSFPLLLTTLKDLLKLCEDGVIFFCFKKRRKADMRFLKTAKKIFIVEEPEDESRISFSREGLFLYTLKLKTY
ncbi:Protein-lysine N-methyltransferase EFM6 [Golovinomyces cichoracearum]|uniref:Protein-lysine N-methyltransferase EFM6 n=1 Tax=Golovinomyces cichoracearum TaxID=62708 RepID=A0A420HLD8_9PEZI|nr:Protein-lysine N-methyltransferase EFM6 [Golovinomyces cichoracearum]